MAAWQPAGGAPAADAAAQPGDVAVAREVAEQDERLHDEGTGSCAAAQDAVAAEHVPAPQAAELSRPHRSRPDGCRAKVDQDRLGCGSAAPAGRPEPESKVDVGH